MIHTSAVFQLLLMLILVGYAILLYRSRLKPGIIRLSALVILAAGTIVHLYGLSLEHFESGFMSSLLRSLIMSIKLFLYDSELIELEEAQHTPYFLDIYMLVFYSAMLTSLSAIIMLFGKRAMTMLSLRFRKKKFAHIFIGINSRSEMIAHGIENEEIAFIEFPSDEKENEMSVKNVIGGVAGEEKKDNFSKKANVTVLRAKCGLRLSDFKGNVFATIGLERLKKFIAPDTAFYILSENCDRNLDELMTLLEDDDLINNTIHVCLSRDGVARYYKTTMKQTGTHFIYPSSLAVVGLMKNALCHPAGVMRPLLTAEGKPTGAVQGEFNALVIGFGETGQAVTKFLYEFSSAVSADGTPMPAHIIVNDERIDSLKGPFLFDSPDMGHSDIIRYENFGTESSEFWDRLMQRLDDLNYIAISLRDDASSLDLACTIFMYAMKKRRNGLDGLRIVVRKKCTLSHEKKLVDKMNEKAGREVIICYGEYETVFTSDMIVSKKKNGINKAATGVADKISAAYTAVSGRTVQTDGRSESFHIRNRARMELHQLISRANHTATVSAVVAGNTQVSDEALENLARMEHLRYSRYLTAHGYSYAAEDDDVFKVSHQICDWNSLTEEDRQYHRDMVRAQLSII